MLVSLNAPEGGAGVPGDTLEAVGSVIVLTKTVGRLHNTLEILLRFLFAEY